jgi:hypothetical protein
VASEIFISIDIGGSGQETNLSIAVVGCDCRVPDYLMALVKFTNDWKRLADQQTTQTISTKPCGCQDAQ